MGTLARELGQLLSDVSAWKVVGGTRLVREISFPDFAKALAFVDRVGALAQAEGHHPDLHLSWGRVRVELWTHAIGGPAQADFVLAAKIDELVERRGRELLAPDIEQYARAHAGPDDPILDELEAETRAHVANSGMLSGKTEGRLLQLLVRLAGARRAVEVGTFTGYGSLMLAAALPDDGHLLTLELDPEHAAVARRAFARHPAGRKVELQLGPALASLQALPPASVDFVFVDADKEHYPAYYDEALRILAPGGVVAFDNALWSGRVLRPEAETDRAIAEVNDRAVRDPRVDVAFLTVRDGVLVLRKR